MSAVGLGRTPVVVVLNDMGLLGRVCVTVGVLNDGVVGFGCVTVVSGVGWYCEGWHLVDDKEDSCRWWSIDEESAIAWCDRDELEASPKSWPSVWFWYQCGIANAEWLAFLVSRTTPRSKAFFSEVAEENRDGVTALMCSRLNPRSICSVRKTSVP